jgi:hypothetical protein
METHFDGRAELLGQGSRPFSTLVFFLVMFFILLACRRRKGPAL